MRLFKWSYSYMWWDHLFTVINQLSSILLSRLYILITALYMFSTTMSCNSPLANVVCFTCTTFNKVYLILSYMATKPTVFMLHMIELASASNWKSILRSRDGGASIHCIMCSLYKKNIPELETNHIWILLQIHILSKCSIAVEWTAFQNHIIRISDALWAFEDWPGQALHLRGRYIFLRNTCPKSFPVVGVDFEVNTQHRKCVTVPASDSTYSDGCHSDLNVDNPVIAPLVSESLADTTGISAENFDGQACFSLTGGTSSVVVHSAPALVSLSAAVVAIMNYWACVWVKFCCSIHDRCNPVFE